MKLFAGVTGQLTRHKSDTVIRDASEQLEGVDIRHEHHIYERVASGHHHTMRLL